MKKKILPDMQDVRLKSKNPPSAWTRYRAR